MNFTRFKLCLLLSGLFVAIASVRGFTLETNFLPLAITFPEVDELREQLGKIERASQESATKWEAVASQNEALSNRLSQMQEALTVQRQRELEIAKEAQAFNFRVLAGAAIAVLIVLGLSYLFQLRCLNRVVELTRTLNALPPSTGPALLHGETPGNNSQLLAALKLLEHRIEDWQAAQSAGAKSSVPAEAQQLASTRAGNADAPPLPSSAALFLEKGQTLFDSERLQEALNCFQEAAALEPENSDAHFKSGITLERLNRLEPALSAYEEVIRLNPKKTLAYVYKARVLQGLQRFDEALSVYDSAMGRNNAHRETPVFTS